MVRELVPLRHSYGEMRRALKERHASTPKADNETIGVAEKSVPAEESVEPPTGSDPVSLPQPVPPAPAARDRPLKCVLRIPYPAPGTNPAFDRITQVYGEDEAVRLIFARAFDRWIDGFSESATLTPTAGYPVTKSKFYKAGRNIDAKIIEQVRARVDPYGLRKVGWLAQSIGLAAMNDEMDRLHSEAANGEKSEGFPRKSEK